MSKILVVDDERSVRLLLRTLLEREGYQVIEAADGQAALAAARQELPDVILMDIIMPVLDGLRACMHLKQDAATRDIPLLVVTKSPDSKREAIEIGIDDFLAKPFDLEEVTIRVRAMLKIANLQNELKRVSSYITNLEAERKRSAEMG